MKIEWIIKSLIFGLIFGSIGCIIFWNIKGGLLLGLFAMIYYLIRRPMLELKSERKDRNDK